MTIFEITEEFSGCIVDNMLEHIELFSTVEIVVTVCVKASQEVVNGIIIKVQLLFIVGVLLRVGVM